MKNMNKGFTLIELVVVIVIIGILAVTAVPRFIDLTSDARQAKADGVAGALASGSAINYAASLARGQVNGGDLTTVGATTGVTDTSGGCTGAVAAGLMNDASIDFTGTDYDVSGPASIANVGDAVSCTLTDANDAAAVATFNLIGTK